MDRQPGPLLMVTVGVLFTVAMLAPIATMAQTRRATVVTVEGSTQTWHVIGKDGQEVAVDIPSQSPIDIETGKAAQKRARGSSAPRAGRVQATVVAVDTITNRVKMQTQRGQIIELETPVKGIRLGEKVTLVVP